MKWLIGIVLIIAVIGGAYFFLNGIQNATVEKFELTTISDMNRESFTLNGNLFIKNPSRSPIPIEKIDYEVYLKDTNQKIGEGRINGFILESAKTTTVPFDEEIRWAPTASVIEQLLTKEKVIVQVKGKIRVGTESFSEQVPFSSEIDMKEYIKNKIRSPEIIRNLT